MDAFGIALNLVDGKGWYTSTLDLQLVSFQLCVLCRSVSTLHLTVSNGISTRVWKDVPSSEHDREATKLHRSPIPVLRPRILTWKLRESRLSQCSSELVGSVEHLVIHGSRAREGNMQIPWPSVKQLTFENLCDRDVTSIEWPSGLRKLTFGGDFNQAIDGVSWPASLQHLTLGRRFNRPINKIAWPASL